MVIHVWQAASENEMKEQTDKTKRERQSGWGWGEGGGERNNNRTTTARYHYVQILQLNITCAYGPSLAFLRVNPCVLKIICLDQ